MTKAKSLVLVLLVDDDAGYTLRELYIVKGEGFIYRCRSVSFMKNTISWGATCSDRCTCGKINFFEYILTYIFMNLRRLYNKLLLNIISKKDGPYVCNARHKLRFGS